MAYVSTWIDKRGDILKIAEQVRADHPAAWEEVKVHGQTSRTFINLVSIALLKAGIPGGVNLKRGGPQESLDALAFPNASGARDATGKYPGVEIIDIIGSAERADASLTWGDVTQKTIDAGVPGGWKAGSLTTSTPVPAPAPPPAPSFPYPDEPTFWKAFQDAITRIYKEAGRSFPDPNDADAFRRFSRCGYDCRGMDAMKAAEKHLKELRVELGLPV